MTNSSTSRAALVVVLKVARDDVLGELFLDLLRDFIHLVLDELEATAVRSRIPNGGTEENTK